jgi:hypothetical protein
MFVLPDAAELVVTCGDAVGRGTTAARLTNFPAGPCRVDARYLGSTVSTEVQVDQPAEISCSVEGGSLTCH